MTGLRSCLYPVSVSHSRVRPRPHAFRHRLFTFGLDLDEIPQLARTLRLFSHNRRALYAFHDADYLPLGAPTLRENIVRFGSRHGLDLAAARVLIVAMPRIAGHCYNPVSFYFCSDDEGRPLCVIVEVTNTFRERKAYLVRPDSDGRDSDRDKIPKLFYVSPFLALDSHFVFDLPEPGDRLRLRADAHDADGPILYAAMAGARRELTDANLAALTLRYPLASLGVLALIHVHALMLFLKRIPWHRKADRRDLQVDLLPGSHPASPTPISAEVLP